ncbi:hypothetical protein [Flexivirga caeni]|uniref:DUF2029 domain-containing protein n=1 Tax=Flexivirga caeni TaxID=2294115 RepID=A0A3M9MH35_9MICO|nr:hypothetical protein [Flexivirga caeni]RNI24826.1 hypothetical protein EFY87_03805 [Flexivirga caeni]
MARVWFVLTTWATLWSLLQVPGGMYSWHYFATGAGALSRLGSAGGGLHVYAVHPELQMGPLALLSAITITAAGGSASAALGALVMTALGLMSIWLLVAAAGSVRGQPPSPRSTLLVGLPLMPVWAVLSVHYGHLDDALAMSLTTAALCALIRDRPWLATMLVAAAGAAKPWALPFALILLAHPVNRARRVSAFVALSALAWMPFLLADPSTLQRLGSFVITNAPDSALRALGIQAATTPPWDRAAQLCFAAAFALWCVRIGRPVAVPAIALAVRLLLDPGTYPYYTASLLLAVTCVDLLQRWYRSVPWLTLSVATWFIFSITVATELPAAVVGTSRAIFLAGLIAYLTMYGAGRNEFPWGAHRTRHRQPVET